MKSKKRELILRERERVRRESGDIYDPVPAGSPLQTAQLIGSLVIRFVMYAESGMSWNEFPDKPLVEAILRNCKDRSVAEQHLVELLFHHSKILDNCGTPEPKLRKLVKDAFPKAMLETPDWEIVPID